MTTLSIKATIGFILVGVTLVVLMIACYNNIKSAQGPKERAFITVASLTVAALLGLLGVLLYCLRTPYNLIVTVLFLLTVPVLIYRFSVRRQLIREVERMGLDDAVEVAKQNRAASAE